MDVRNQSLMSGVTYGQRRRDGGQVDWTAPNRGKYPVSHVDTFLNRYTSLASVYRDYDEALLDDRSNARFMRNDVGIRECLDSRQRSVALLNWHIEPENSSSADQREFCSLLEAICRRISHFTEYRRNCQHAIWYGKYGIQHRWGVQIVNNRSVWMPTPRHQDDWGWKPLNGDKLVFRQQRPDRPLQPGEYEGQVGIRVGNRYSVGDVINGRWKVQPTDYGLGYFLSPNERRLLLIHKHHIEDADYADGVRAGSIYGVGIRSVIYWEWYQKQETMAFLMEFLERMAGGIQVWKYPQGNQQAHDEAKSAAEGYNSGEQHILLVPVPVGDTGQYGVEIIDPGFQGVETLHQLLTQYFGHRIKRYILVQVLSSESEATGMGSGVAELHADTLLQILQSDSANLEETLTSDLLGSIIQINVQKGLWSEPGFRPRFVIQTEQADIDKQLQAWTSLLDRGLSFRKRDLYQLVGAAIPGPGDDVLDPKGQLTQKSDPHGQQPSGKPPVTSGATGGGLEPPVSSKSDTAPTTPSAQPNTNADQRHNRSLTRQS
jgi:phage gp29-like protein